jgi:hypothetical protein
VVVGMGGGVDHRHSLPELPALASAGQASLPPQSGLSGCLHGVRPGLGHDQLTFSGLKTQPVRSRRR